ncbi:MAG: ribonuclease D [Pseudomonadota bacterium]
MDWQLIASDHALSEALVAAAGHDAVAVDTEFMRRNTFFPQAALLQLSFGEAALLIDPLAIQDTTGLVALLTDPGIVKVLHSASEDLEVFNHWLGVLPYPLFDTQRGAALLDKGFSLGYGSLVEQMFGETLPKGETRSDWLNRPLTPSQCEYAAQDVAWLLPMWRDLQAQCDLQGKSDWVLSDGSDALDVFRASDGDALKRMKSAWKLDPRQLSRLVAICNWRESTARRRDKPRGWIIDDQVCMQLALQDPSTPQQLNSSVEMDHRSRRRYGDELLHLLEQQRSKDDADLPPRLPQPLDSRQRNQVKQLKTRLRSIASDVSAAPEALVQSKDYELLLREAAGTEIARPSHWDGWRREVVIDPLRAHIATLS